MKGDKPNKPLLTMRHVRCKTCGEVYLAQKGKLNEAQTAHAKRCKPVLRVHYIRRDNTGEFHDQVERLFSHTQWCCADALFVLRNGGEFEVTSKDEVIHSMLVHDGLDDEHPIPMRFCPFCGAKVLAIQGSHQRYVSVEKVEWELQDVKEKVDP